MKNGINNNLKTSLSEKTLHRYVVETEYFDCIDTSGVRAFLCNNDPYYDGSDYAEARRVYDELVAESDGKTSAVVLFAAPPLDEDGCETDGLYEVVETNEIPVVEAAHEDEARCLNLDNGSIYGDITVDEIADRWDEIEPHWDTLVQAMDDKTRELVHDWYAPCSGPEFLRQYLRYADTDLVIG